LVMSMTPANDETRITATGLLGDAAFAEEHFGDAIRYYREYLAARPRDLNTRRNLTKVLLNQGDLERAATEAREILRVADEAEAHDLLGRVFGSQGKLEDTRKEFERALEIDPSFDQARRDLAMVMRAKR